MRTHWKFQKLTSLPHWRCSCSQITWRIKLEDYFHYRSKPLKRMNQICECPFIFADIYYSTGCSKVCVIVYIRYIHKEKTIFLWHRFTEYIYLIDCVAYFWYLWVVDNVHFGHTLTESGIFIQYLIGHVVLWLWHLYEKT